MAKKFEDINRDCSLLQHNWSIPTDNDILSRISYENMLTLKMTKNSNRSHIKLYNCNLQSQDNVRSCYRMLRFCQDLKRIDLEYCKLDDRALGILLKPLAKLSNLLHLGLFNFINRKLSDI